MKPFFALPLLVWLWGCLPARPGPTGCQEGSAPALSAQSPTQDGITLSLALDRDGDSTNVIATATAVDATGAPVDRAITFDVSRGRMEQAQQVSTGVWRARLSPGDPVTGEYTIHARIPGGAWHVQHTAVVLSQVHGMFGQPQAIEGMVNTCGWEDSLAISPDGQWLFLMYVPISITCFFGFNVMADVCRSIEGPVDAPLRPQMFNREKIDDDGQVRHACDPTGLRRSPFPIFPVSMFGFRRQADGSFGEPFALGYENQCNGPFGPSLRVNGDGTMTMVYAWTDTAADGAGNELYSVDFTPGQRVVFGRYERQDGKAVGLDMKHHRFPLSGKNGKGNPHLQLNAQNSVEGVFIDDEGARQQDLYAYRLNGNMPDGPWGERITLPAPINSNEDEIQPYFDGELFLYRRADAIRAARYRGGDWGSADAWEDVGDLIKVNGEIKSGAILTVGEPTMTRINGRLELYFIYAVVRDDFSLDLNAGVVTQRAP